MLEEQLRGIALGLGVAGCLVASGMLLSPGKALAQAPCPGGGGPLCKKVVTCSGYWPNTTICKSETTQFWYYSKEKT